MMHISAYQTSPIAAPVAKWLQNLLLPVVAAARIHVPPPIEFRNTGKYGGFCDHIDLVPDARVSLSKTLLYAGKSRLALIYIHEACHRLGANGHDALFFALQLSLLLRVDSNEIFRNEFSLNASLYDLQDAPPPLVDEPRSTWLPQSLAWAVLQADSLAATELSAEALFALLSTRHDVWLSTLKTSSEIERRAALARQKDQGLRQSIFIRTALALLGWTGFLVTSILFVRYALANH